MLSPNPHTALYALMVLESIVKNCGAPVHEEVANKANCEMYAQLVQTSIHENVRNKMLELIQTWAFAFRSAYKYRGIKVGNFNAIMLFDAHESDIFNLSLIFVVVIIGLVIGHTQKYK